MTNDAPERGRPAQRQSQIVEHVLKHGSVSATDLAEMFHVSLMTIHRDLDELERQGMVRKFRGGVSAQPSSAAYRSAAS